MRPGKLRDERKQHKNYISEQELKAELESQVAERKRQEILAKIMEQEKLLEHYENYNMSKNNDETKEITDFISQKKNELESLKKNLDVSDNFKQQFEKQRIYQEPKKEYSIPNFFSKSNEQQEKLIFENLNQPTLTTGELERQKRLRLREEERMRRLHGIASSAYDDQKSVLPIQIQQSIKIISDQENMTNQKKEKEFERIQKKEEIFSSQPDQKIFYNEFNEKRNNNFVLPHVTIPYESNQNMNNNVFPEQDDVHQREGNASFYQERNRFNGNEEILYKNNQNVIKEVQDNENQNFCKKNLEYFEENSKTSKNEKREIRKNQEFIPEKLKEEPQHEGNKNLKNDRDEMKERQRKYREELDEQIRLKKQQEQIQKEANKFKRAQTTNDSTTPKETRSCKNNSEWQINQDRSFHSKQENMYQISTTENLELPPNNRSNTIKNHKRIESANEGKNDYFKKIELENKQREDEKRKIQLEYQQELKRQILEKEERVKREKEELERREKEQLEKERMLEASVLPIKKGRKMVLKENQEIDFNYNSSNIPQINPEMQCKQYQSANQNENNEENSYKTTFKKDLNNNVNNDSKNEDQNYKSETNQFHAKNNNPKYISEQINHNKIIYEERNMEDQVSLQNCYNQTDPRTGNIQNKSRENFCSNNNNINNNNDYVCYGPTNNNNRYFCENQNIDQAGYNTQMAYNPNVNYETAPQKINSMFKDFYEDFDQQTKLLKEAIEEKLRFEQITKEERFLLQEYKLKIKEILQQKAQYEFEIEKIRHIFEKKYSNNQEADDINLQNIFRVGVGINSSPFCTNPIQNPIMHNPYMQTNMNFLQNLTSLSYLQSYLNPNNNFALLSPAMNSRDKSNLMLNNNRVIDNSYANNNNSITTNLNANYRNNQYEENINILNSNNKMDPSIINTNDLLDLNETLPHQSEFVDNFDKNALEQSYLKDIEIFNEMQNNIYITSVEDENQNVEKYAVTSPKPNDLMETEGNDNISNIDLKEKFKKNKEKDEETPYDNEVFYTEEDFEDFEMKTNKTEKSIDHGYQNAITIMESLIIKDSHLNEEKSNLEKKENNKSEITKQENKQSLISNGNSNFSEENQEKNKSLFSYKNEKNENPNFSRNRLKEKMEKAKLIDSKLIKKQESIKNSNITHETIQNNNNQITFKSIQSIELNRTKEKSKLIQASNANCSDEENYGHNDCNYESINEIQMNSAEIKNNEIFISEEEKSEIMENKIEKNENEDYNKILSNSLFKSNYNFADTQENEKENIQDHQNNASLSLSFAEEIEYAKKDLNIVKFKKPKIVDVFSLIEKKKQLAETSAIEDKKNMILKRIENFIKEIDSSNF